MNSMIEIKNAPKEILKYFLDKNNIVMRIAQDSKTRYTLQTSPYMLYSYHPTAGNTERIIYGKNPLVCISGFIEEASCCNMIYCYGFLRRKRERKSKFIDVPNLILGEELLNYMINTKITQTELDLLVNEGVIPMDIELAIRQHSEAEDLRIAAGEKVKCNRTTKTLSCGEEKCPCGSDCICNMCNKELEFCDEDYAKELWEFVKQSRKATTA